MYRRLCFLAPGILLASLTCVASADSEQSAREVFQKHRDQVFGVKAIIKAEVTVQGRPAAARDAQLWTNGTVVGDGLVAVSYGSLHPNVSAQLRGRAEVDVKTKLEEVQLVNGAGEEFDARLVLHDEALGIAFVALDRDADNAENWDAEAVDLSEDVELSHLEETVILSRSNESMRFQPAVRLGRVEVVVLRPRRIYSVSNLRSSAAVFNLQGQFVGLSIQRSASGGGARFFHVVLPAKYIRKLVPQALEKATLKDEETKNENEKEDTDLTGVD